MHLSKLNIYSRTLMQVGQIPMDAAIGRAYDAVLEVLLHYQQSPDMLERIRTRIDIYVIEGELVSVFCN